MARAVHAWKDRVLCRKGRNVFYWCSICFHWPSMDGVPAVSFWPPCGVAPNSRLVWFARRECWWESERVSRAGVICSLHYTTNIPSYPGGIAHLSLSEECCFVAVNFTQRKGTVLHRDVIFFFPVPGKDSIRKILFFQVPVLYQPKSTNFLNMLIRGLISWDFSKKGASISRILPPIRCTHSEKLAILYKNYSWYLLVMLVSFGGLTLTRFNCLCVTSLFPCEIEKVKRRSIHSKDFPSLVLEELRSAVRRWKTGKPGTLSLEVPGKVILPSKARAFMLILFP